MKKKLTILALTGVLALGASAAQAIPTLQLGSYALSGSGQGTYVDYTTIGSDEETVFISAGYQLLAAGSYKDNKKQEYLIGGQYTGGLDWTDFGLQFADFAGKGAIIMATVADGSRNNAAAILKLAGNDPFLKLDTFIFANNHYPVGQTRDFFFFDIGDFAKNAGATTNFNEIESGSATGELKSLSIFVDGLDNVHFDLMALVTNYDNQTGIQTTWDVNPGSHDVTWNEGAPVPEPATMLLMGTGLAGLAAAQRRRKAKKSCATNMIHV